MAKKFKIDTLTTELGKLGNSSNINFTNIKGNEDKFVAISNMLTAFQVISQSDREAKKSQEANKKEVPIKKRGKQPRNDCFSDDRS